MYRTVNQPENKGHLPGGNPAGISAAESDQLFKLHIGYLLSGVAQGSPSSTGGGS
jgi:hypothetical protein